MGWPLRPVLLDSEPQTVMNMHPWSSETLVNTSTDQPTAGFQPVSPTCPSLTLAPSGVPKTHHLPLASADPGEPTRRHPGLRPRAPRLCSERAGLRGPVCGRLGGHDPRGCPQSPHRDGRGFQFGIRRRHEGERENGGGVNGHHEIGAGGAMKLQQVRPADLPSPERRFIYAQGEHTALKFIFSFVDSLMETCSHALKVCFGPQPQQCKHASGVNSPPQPSPANSPCPPTCSLKSPTAGRVQSWGTSRPMTP